MFVEIAKQRSFSDAAEVLNMTKGAVSYQVKTLEQHFGVRLFERTSRGVSLTQNGRDLLAISAPHYRELEEKISTFKKPRAKTLTVGMSSYFASRWLSARLMTFMQTHPDIQLRIQPMTQLFDLNGQDVDIAIRWGDGNWDDAEITPLMPMPAWPVGNKDTAAQISQYGLEQTFSEATLLRDHDESNGWSDWLTLAGLPPQTRKDTLIIPDPNVRVQAVIDGQGVAIMDTLVTPELEAGQLVRLSEVALTSYGYFLANPNNMRNSDSVSLFTDWLKSL
ncbi:MAG: LysR substrate-binding domain-containing protein [Paracoccaceae bacterium]|nr:LysR substrate-binding domain-containing protein [Paracoccaceae bacterium]